jgi:hypothetical protein
MTEPVARALLVGGVVVAALLVAVLVPLRERRRAEHHPLDLTGLPDGSLLFTSAGCRRCDGMRAALDRLGVWYSEVRHEDDPGVVAGAGVPGVPLFVVRDASGCEVGRVGGRPSLRRLRRLLERASGE